MILLDWVWPGASSFQPTIVSLRDLQGSKLIESLPPAFQSSHEQLVLPISGRGRAGRLVTKNFHLPFKHMYEALNVIK